MCAEQTSPCVSKAVGRLAPTPTGELHMGHALTFFTAHCRVRDAGGCLYLRIEDLDANRCRREFVESAIADLRWLGLDWDGEPVFQSQRQEIYLKAWRRLRDGGFIYPCTRSRRDMSTLAPHSEEPVFPVEWRSPLESAFGHESPAGVNWRFRVPDDRVLEFNDASLGPVRRTSLKDFGDFLVWNRDDIPSYELAVVVDDLAMGITEVVRGADLLTSTARQMLLYEALEAAAPAWFHCPLVCDAAGKRLAKRSGGMSLKELREMGLSPRDVLELANSSLLSCC